MTRAQIITEAATHDVAFCRCGGMLEFTTNLSGGVVQKCLRCRCQGLMQRAPKRDMAVITSEPLVAGRRCVDCGGITMRRPNGKSPLRCFDCREKHNNANAIAWRKKRPGSA